MSNEEQENTKLQTLIADLANAKQQEKEASQTRKELEEEIAEEIGKQEALPERGQHSTQVGAYKVTIKNSINYKADVDAIKKTCAEVGFEYPPVKTKEELDTKGYEWLRENHPELFKQVSAHVTAKPSKPSVQVALT